MQHRYYIILLTYYSTFGLEKNITTSLMSGTVWRWRLSCRRVEKTTECECVHREDILNTHY